MPPHLLSVQWHRRLDQWHTTLHGGVGEQIYDPPWHADEEDYEEVVYASSIRYVIDAWSVDDLVSTPLSPLARSKLGTVRLINRQQWTLSSLSPMNSYYPMMRQFKWGAWCVRQGWGGSSGEDNTMWGLNSGLSGPPHRLNRFHSCLSQDLILSVILAEDMISVLFIRTR
jgi:hypothetical protein